MARQEMLIFSKSFDFLSEELLMGFAIALPILHYLSITIVRLNNYATKIRELIIQLKKAGVKNRGGRGSHYNFIHPKGIAITISGKLDSDAKKYQENEMKRKLMES